MQAGEAHLAFHAKCKEQSRKKPRWELKQGPSPSIKLGKLVDHIRFIDRANDHYFEQVVDLESGERLHTAEEPLSAHQAHGSATSRKDG
jgi:hypothetical protein